MALEIKKHIKTLPPLPQSVAKIQQITSDPNGTIMDLAKVIKEDPLLTAVILKAANSPMYGFSRQIKSIDQAVSMFGMSTVKGLAVASAVRNTLPLDLSAYGIDENKFTEVSQLQNSIVVNWYKRQASKLDILSTASFLLEIGAVVISSALSNAGLADEFRERLQEEDRIELEKEYANMDTEEITSLIFNHWKFDIDLVNAIRFSSKLDKADEDIIEYAAVLATARKIVDITHDVSDESIKEALEMAEKYKLDTNTLKQAIQIATSA
ncbi:MAG: HDOD domain-containing protein [Epsilonproteobacteria bacterium]|nr:HDOD domain-containing protein [Campylobacterota bacterium]